MDIFSSPKIKFCLFPSRLWHNMCIASQNTYWTSTDVIRNIKRQICTSDEYDVLFCETHKNFIHNYTLLTQTTEVACQSFAVPLIITAFLQGFSGFILHQWCQHWKGSKFTSRSRRRVDTGSNPPHGCGGEDGGSSRAVGHCVQLWRVDEVQDGRWWALHLHHWDASEIWRSLQIWRKAKWCCGYFSCIVILTARAFLSCQWVSEIIKVWRTLNYYTRLPFVVIFRYVQRSCLISFICML